MHTSPTFARTRNQAGGGGVVEITFYLKGQILHCQAYGSSLLLYCSSSSSSKVHHAALYSLTQTFPLPPKKAHVAPCAQTRLVAAVVVLLVLSKTCIMQIGKRIYTLLLRQCSQAGPANQQGMFSYILEIAHHCHRHRKQVCSPFRCRIAAAVVALGLGMLSRGGEGGVKSSFHVPRPVAWTINMPRLSPSDIFNFQTYIHSSTTDTTMQYVLR